MGNNYSRPVNGVQRAEPIQGTDVNSGAASSGQVLTANGTGGSSFQTVSGGSSTITATAGQNLNTNDAVYIASSSDTGRTAGNAYQVDATNTQRIEFVGIVTAGVSSGNPVTIQTAGSISGFSGLTVGKPIFASVTTPGSYQESAPVLATQWVMQLGVAATSSSILINASGSAIAIYLVQNTNSGGTTPRAGQSFLTSGTTYTTPSTISTVTQFKFTLIGGGGGGGGINTASANGSGGGGGGAVVVYATGLSASTGYTIQIGAAGAGGISTTTAATAGTSTTISLDAITYTAGGGSGGADTVSTAGGAGGTVANTFGTGFSTGGFQIAGAAGRGSTLANADSFSGDGGSSPLGFGQGGPAFTTSTAGTGIAGSGYGAGGSAGRGATATGGAGTAGCILVEFWN
jgi:hypothetical protein